MSTTTSDYLTGLVIATTPRRGGRPTRDLRLEHAAGAVLTIDWMAQGIVGYAGDVENPRPVRPRSLYDVKKWMADKFPNMRYRGALPETTLFFVFRNNQMTMPLEQAVPVPREDLWWLAAPGDMVLLSDRTTHHYTSVYHVDADADRIEFLDAWPDRFFLKKGLNLAGVEAVDRSFGADESKPGRGRRISVTRDEFLRVVVGLITKDTPELIEHYTAYRPEMRGRVEMQLAFGLAFMEAEMYALASFAVAHFATALRLAEAAQDAERVAYAAARLHVALVAAVHRQGWFGEPLGAKPFHDELRHLTARHARDSLLEGARSRELCSLAYAAGRSQDYAAAHEFADLAVKRFPDEEEPWRLRAKIRMNTKDYRGAVEDATEALARNARRVRQLEEQREAWHPHDRSSRDDDASRIAGLGSRRLEELEIRGLALIALDRLAEARTNAEEIVAQAPDSSTGYKHLAEIEGRLGDPSASGERLRQAREREQDPRQRALIDALSGMPPAASGDATPTETSEGAEA